MIERQIRLARRAFPQGEIRHMKLNAQVPVTAGLTALLLLSSTGCKRLRANDQINKGVSDFKNAKYESAENHFQQAIQIDPDNPNPHIYLATTYASQVVPNLDTPENKKLAQQAKAGFLDVLNRDPNDVIALKQIASLDRSVGNEEEAKDYGKKVIALEPNDAESYYTIGTVDFYHAQANTKQVLARENLTDNGEGNVKLSKAQCASLVTANSALISEGMEYLQKAVEIDPLYENAMSIMSLMYRRKADIECGNVPAIKADISNAEQWAQKSMGARAAIEKKKEEKSKGGITQ
jgi:tetratricopeptide (TPR) repeat protein